MKFLKISAKLCLMLLASLFAGIFLLWCVFLLPDRLTQTHAARSAETFSYEGIGAAVGYTYADQLDNWTDALMIGNACYQKEDASALNRAAAAYRPDYQNGDPITSLDAYVKAEEDVGSIAYPRYWHGYLVALRPLLMVTDYLGIRSINTVFFAVTILLLVLVIIKRKQYQLFLPLGITILFLRPLAIIHSLQLSTVFYPTMLSVIVCIYFQKWMCREGHFLYLFLMNGIVIAYADLLTYPVASLGVLLTVFMMIQEKNGACREDSADCGWFSRLGIWLFWHVGRKMADFFDYFTSECFGRCRFAGTGPRFQQLWRKSFFQSDGIYAEYRCRIYRCSGISGGCLSSVDDFYAVEK